MKTRSQFPVSIKDPCPEKILRLIAIPGRTSMKSIGIPESVTTIGGITGCLLGISLVPLASTWTGWP